MVRLGLVLLLAGSRECERVFVEDERAYISQQLSVKCRQLRLVVAEVCDTMFNISAPHKIMSSPSAYQLPALLSKAKTLSRCRSNPDPRVGLVGASPVVPYTKLCQAVVLFTVLYRCAALGRTRLLF